MSSYSLLMSIIILREREAELPKIIIKSRNVYKFMDFDIRKTYVDPSWAPYDASYPYSGLNQHPYLTNKHNHFKKMGG